MAQLTTRRLLKKTTTNPNVDLWNPVPIDASKVQLPHLRIVDHCGREDRKKCRSQKNREFAVRLCLIVMSEATHIVLSA